MQPEIILQSLMNEKLSTLVTSLYEKDKEKKDTLKDIAMLINLKEN